MKRSLYQCFNAKVLGDEIYCDKGHLSENILRLARGTPLELSICQTCSDYDEMGPPIPKDERGWLSIKEVQS